MSDKRYILTIATGKKTYTNMAANLARSFLWWHQNSDIQFQLVTDQPASVPADIKDKIQIIEVEPGQLGKGFSAKLQLDNLVCEGKTLFIDSDCLVFGPLNGVFDKFNNLPVSVVGDYMSTGEWFGDVTSICKKFNVPRLPKFNGGIYYLEKGEISAQVYTTARQLEKQYDEIGFIRLRGQPNDEVLMALAMQLHNQVPVPDDGTIMSDPQACRGNYTIDVIKGNRLLINPPPPSQLHQNWYPFEKVAPLIVHFLGHYALHYPYRREAYRLDKALNHQSTWLSNLKSIAFIEYPERLNLFLKNTFRAAFHKIFGVRKIKSSDRTV